MEPGKSTDGLDALIGRALTDSEFRTWLLNDPAAAAASMGVCLTEDQIAHIKGLNPDAVEWWVSGSAYSADPGGIMGLW